MTISFHASRCAQAPLKSALKTFAHRLFHASSTYEKSELLSPVSACPGNSADLRLVKRGKDSPFKKFDVLLYRIRRRPVVLLFAPRHEAAEVAAARTFDLGPEQRSRLIVQERGVRV